MTLTEFLLARIAEDEANIRGPWAQGDDGLHIITVAASDRMLAECEAKRRIVERNIDASADGDDWATTAWEVMCFLAAIYADHPDYLQEWRP